MASSTNENKNKKKQRNKFVIFSDGVREPYMALNLIESTGTIIKKRHSGSVPKIEKEKKKKLYKFWMWPLGVALVQDFYKHLLL